VEWLALHAGTMLLSATILLLTAASIKSAFFFTCLVATVLAWEVVVVALVGRRAAHLIRHLILLPPLTMVAYIAQLLLTIFLHIMGHRGA